MSPNSLSSKPRRRVNSLGKSVGEYVQADGNKAAEMNTRVPLYIKSLATQNHETGVVHPHTSIHSLDRTLIPCGPLRASRTWQNFGSLRDYVVIPVPRATLFYGSIYAAFFPYFFDSYT